MDVVSPRIVRTPGPARTFHINLPVQRSFKSVFNSEHPQRPPEPVPDSHDLVYAVPPPHWLNEPSRENSVFASSFRRSPKDTDWAGQHPLLRGHGDGGSLSSDKLLTANLG